MSHDEDNDFFESQTTRLDLLKRAGVLGATLALFGLGAGMASSQLTNVILNHRTTVEINLEDYDPLNENDPIGDVMVSAAELRAALRAGRPAERGLEGGTARMHRA